MNFKLQKSNLNFRVYATPDIPKTGMNNDVCVISEVPMTNWILSPDAPSSAPRNDGDVWLTYSVDGNAFNALKQNSMMIAMISAKQYVDGVWVEKTAKSCQNGEWVDWFVWNGELYIDKDQYEPITGGWWNNTGLYYQSGSTTYSAKPVDLNTALDTNISLSGNGGFSSVSTKNKIDLTNYTKLLFNIASGSSTDQEMVFIHTFESGNIRNERKSSSGTLDLSDIEGEYYITVGALNTRSVKVGNIRLE